MQRCVRYSVKNERLVAERDAIKKDAAKLKWACDVLVKSLRGVFDGLPDAVEDVINGRSKRAYTKFVEEQGAEQRRVRRKLNEYESGQAAASHKASTLHFQGSWKTYALQASVDSLSAIFGIDHARLVNYNNLRWSLVLDPAATPKVFNHEVVYAVGEMFRCDSVDDNKTTANLSRSSRTPFALFLQ